MANITRFDPFGEMLTLRQAVDRLFEDSIVSPRSMRGVAEGVVPALDVYETPEHLVVSVALPGVSPDDVEITMTGQTLIIRGQLREAESVKPEQYLYRERRHGAFSRQLELPIRVASERAEATFDSGLLRLSIPKAEETRARQIRIKAGEQGSERGHGSETG